MFFLLKKIKYLYLLLTHPLMIFPKILKDFKKDFFSKRFNSNINFIWCAGLPKSGTSMIEQIIEQLPFVRLDNSLLRNFDNRNLDHPHGISKKMFSKIPKKKYTFLKTHTHYSLEYEKIANDSNAKIIISVRDIRDMLISRYYHLMYDKKHSMNKHISELNFEEGFLLSISKHITNKTNALTYYSEWISNWYEIAEKKKYLILRYEDYFTDQEKYISQILNYLKLQNQFDTKKINKTLILERGKNSNFEKNINNRGVLQKTFRSGKTGEWKSLFTDKINDYISKNLGSNHRKEIFYSK